MADRTTDSPTSGGSRRPSPEDYSDVPSSNASPVSATTSLYMAQPSDEGESSTQRITQDPSTRPAADVTRSHSGASKGGCWTCRLRRKKCDEERDHEGGPCKTCRRLNIECLGWGAKRPDWMRDKEKVAAYKANIKEQLTRAGLIRGQPRSTYMSPTSSLPPGVAGPGPSSGRYAPSVEGRYHPTPYPSSSRNRPSSGSTSTFRDPASARRSPTSLNYTMSPMPPMNDPYHPQPFSYPHEMSPTIPIPHNEESPYTTPYLTPTTPAATQLMLVPQGQSPVSVSHEDYVFHYFESVRKLQYVFAGNSLTNALYSIFVADPGGPVANTICALSSLHHMNLRIAQGLQTPHAPQQTNVSVKFYQQARYQLRNNLNLRGQYSETDAVAAVQLVSYATLSGGWRDWTEDLEVAWSWLAQTRIHEEQNPKLILYKMGPVSRFAAMSTMWIDVLSSITAVQPPRFLPLYTRLFGGGAGFWASPQPGDLRMDALTGCPEEALLAIAEVSALAHWKAVEMQNGSLSVRELIRRGDQIETQLRQRSAPRSVGEGNLTPLDPSLASTMLDPHLPLAGVMPSGVSSSSSAAVTGQTNAISKHDAAALVADIFRETAALYLHTVLSEALPGVPEINSAVDKLIALLNMLPPSEYDRAILFPLFLMGCMTDDRNVRLAILRRFRMLDDTFQNITQIVTRLETLWNERDAIHAHHGLLHHGGNIVVHWRESLRNQWANLLLL